MVSHETQPVCHSPQLPTDPFSSLFFNVFFVSPSPPESPNLSDSDSSDDGNSNDGPSADRYISTQVPSWAVSFRADGRLVAIGGYGGMVNVCDTNSRATLRTFTDYNKAINKDKNVGYCRSVAWMADGDKVVSGGDDGVLRIYSLSSGNRVRTIAGHGDAIRSVLASVGSPDVVVTGSYDHTIRVWNCRFVGDAEGNEKRGRDKKGERQDKDSNENCLALFDHGSPVETLLALPGGNLIVSGGSTFMKIWDLITKTCIHSVSNHSKTITSLTLAPYHNTNRIISGGMDGHLKIYDVSDFTLLQQQKYNAPVTCVGVSPDASRFVVGTNDGVVIVKQREAAARPDLGLTPKKKIARGNTYNHFNRGANSSASVGDFSVQVDSKKKLKEFDKALKAFRYADALDAALATKQPLIVVAVLEALMQRRGLPAALGSRDEHELEQILAFTCRYLANPRYTPLLTVVATELCELYEDKFGRSDMLDELFVKLKTVVDGEVKVMKEILAVEGVVDAILMS